MNVPRKARQDAAVRGRLLKILQPRSLRNAMGGLSSSAPDELSGYVDAICAYTPPESVSVDAFADAPCRTSRLVTVTQGFMWLIMVSVVLFEELESPVRQTAGKILRVRGKQILEPLAALQQIDELASDVYADLALSRRADDLISTLLDSKNSPNGLKAVFDAITSGPPPSRLTHALIDAALRFVLAHEVSHHLLNHTPRRAPPSTAPGEVFLLKHCERIGMEPLSATMPRHHAHEFSADALGFLLMTCGNMAEDGEESYFRSVISVAGSFIALPALSLIDEADTAAVSQTHPSLLTRCARLGELSLRFCPPNPRAPILESTIGREIAGSPSAAGLQLWLVIGVIARRMDELASR